MGQSEISSRAVLDMQAYRQAVARASASQLVADQQLRAAVDAVYREVQSVRRTADLLGVPKSTVARLTVLGEGAVRLVERREQVDELEYRAAHNAAWRHYPPAQMDAVPPASG